MTRASVGSRVVLAGTLAVLASLGAMAGAADPAIATPPCPPMEYAVAFSAPTWSVTVLNNLPWPLTYTWYLSPWNGSYVSLADHVGRPASTAERVTFQDRDGSGNLSGSDELQIWDEGGGLRLLQLATGANVSSLGTWWGIRLEDGYRFVCATGPRGIDFVLLGAIVGLGVGIAAVPFVVWRVRRRDGRVRRP